MSERRPSEELWEVVWRRFVEQAQPDAKAFVENEEALKRALRFGFQAAWGFVAEAAEKGPGALAPNFGATAVPFYEYGTVGLVPPEPDDKPGHPNMIFMFSHADANDMPEIESTIAFVACGRCLMEQIEQAITGASDG